MSQQNTTPEPDWKAHAIALAAAIQQFRNEPALGALAKLRATPGYGDLCAAWEDYRDSGAPVLTKEGGLRNAV